MFRYDTTIAQTSSVWLTNYIIRSLAALRDVGFTVADTIPKNAMSYLQKTFYDQQKYCVQKKTNCEMWALEGMDTIIALLEYTP